MKIIQEFKEFAVKGNVIDLAVGVIIGGAFGKIVTSFVSDILMPPIGLLLGGVDFKSLQWVLKDAVMEGTKVSSPAINFNYGNFIQSVVDFLIIAFSIFMFIKVLNKLKKEEAKEEKKEKLAEETKSELLLAEIRDLLKAEKLK